MITSIVFDLGGVLFTNGTKKFVGYLQSTYDLDKEKIIRMVDRGKVPDAYREGKMTRDQYWDKVQDEFHLPESIESLERKWISGYELIKETRDIIFELSKNYKVYFLSDNVKERVEALDKKYHFLSWFDDGIFSHSAGVRKPNKKIYGVLFKKIGVKPEEIVFIDDKETALQPASEMGMSTILFDTSMNLRDELRKVGVSF